ncbi:MAG TPA: hypothetical protein DEQ90_12300, partial [Halieaceae bacterium]|nr:hypothetical protein [Halieaceae bacterium]
MSVEFHNRAPQSTEGALHLVFQGGQLVSDMHTEPLLPRAELQQLGWLVVREQFLGYWHGRPCFAVEIDAGIEPDPMR